MKKIIKLAMSQRIKRKKIVNDVIRNLLWKMLGKCVGKKARNSFYCKINCQCTFPLLCMHIIYRYDKKDTSKISLVDLQFICALGPPGGGRNPITPRFVRHFNIVSVAKFNDDTMTRIFSSIVSFYFKVCPYYVV